MAFLELDDLVPGTGRIHSEDKFLRLGALRGSIRVIPFHPVGELHLVSIVKLRCRPVNTRMGRSVSVLLARPLRRAVYGHPVLDSLRERVSSVFSGPLLAPGDSLRSDAPYDWHYGDTLVCTEEVLHLPVLLSKLGRVGEVLCPTTPADRIVLTDGFDGVLGRLENLDNLRKGVITFSVVDLRDDASTRVGTIDKDDHSVLVLCHS